MPGLRRGAAGNPRQYYGNENTISKLQKSVYGRKRNDRLYYSHIIDMRSAADLAG